MNNKEFAKGVVVGAVITAAIIVIIIYLEDERNKKALTSTDFFKNHDKGHHSNIINLNAVPKEIRKEFSHSLATPSNDKNHESHSESIKRVQWLKNIIENQGGHEIFFKDGEIITREKDLHVLYNLTWFSTKCDVNKEVNNGRGPVDFKISIGLDQTLIEFKLASNTHLKKNLQKQLDIYAKANDDPAKIIVIICVTEKQEKRVKNILQELELDKDKNVIVIDGRNDNKPSASAA